MPSEEAELCKFRIRLEKDDNTQRWWLMSEGNLHHNDHPPLREEARLAGESNLTPDQMKFIMQMCDHNVCPSTISDIMTKLVGKEFTADTIANIGRKVQQAIDIAEGITPEMTSAERTLERLQRYVLLFFTIRYTLLSSFGLL